MAAIVAPLEWITGSPWTYVITAGSIAGSAVFPPLPSESVLVTAMSLAVAGELDLVLVCLATTTGAWVGELAAYAVGRSISRRARHRAAASVRGEAALQWLQGRQESWGPGLVVAGRFVPGGTTAVGVSAGILAYPLRRFAPFAALGALMWTLYGTAVAFLGVVAFPGNMWAGVLLAVVIAVAAGALVHAVRTVRHRRRPDG